MVETPPPPPPPTAAAAYKTLEISPLAPNSRVYNLRLNRPKVLNALSLEFFTELPSAISLLDQHPAVAAVVLSGAGPHFCSGIDLRALSSISTDAVSGSPDRGRVGEKLRRRIKAMQDAITAVERCRKPMIAAVHGFCIGGGIDLITACDIRYCTQDTFFSVKEVDMGMTADLGTLQRLPGIVGFGNAMELSLTGRRFSGSEAKELGLVSKVFSSKEEMWAAVGAIAEEIAAKSPLALTGTKAVLLRSRDLTLDQALDYVATWNSGLLLSDDLTEAVSAHNQKRKPKFSKL